MFTLEGLDPAQWNRDSGTYVWKTQNNSMKEHKSVHQMFHILIDNQYQNTSTLDKSYRDMTRTNPHRIQITITN